LEPRAPVLRAKGGTKDTRRNNESSQKHEEQRETIEPNNKVTERNTTPILDKLKMAAIAIIFTPEHEG
jgi:hypothetical protein